MHPNAIPASAADRACGAHPHRALGLAAAQQRRPRSSAGQLHAPGLLQRCAHAGQGCALALRLEGMPAGMPAARPSAVTLCSTASVHRAPPPPRAPLCRRRRRQACAPGCARRALCRRAAGGAPHTPCVPGGNCGRRADAPHANLWHGARRQPWCRTGPTVALPAQRSPVLPRVCAPWKCPQAEYSLVTLLAAYPRPIISLCQGIWMVRSGGWGGGRHPLVTPRHGGLAALVVPIWASPVPLAAPNA